MHKAILLASLALTACSNKDDKAPAAPPPAAAPTAPGPATPSAPTAATPAAGKLDCDKVLPQALRDKYFKGQTVENIPGVVDFNGKCKIGYVEIDATCHHNMTLGKQATLEQLPKSFPDMKPIDGVPESLARTTKAGFQFTAYDNDSECKIDGIVEKGVDGPAFVKDWLAFLPPK